MILTVVRVALPVPIRQFFDYLLQAESVPLPGCRVKVPFGQRQLIGIVWQVNPEQHYDTSALKAVTALLDPDPVLPASLQKLLGFAADYYHHPIGEVLINALPVLLREGRDTAQYQHYSYQLTPAGHQASAADFSRSPKQLALWQDLKQQPLVESLLLQKHPKNTLKQLLGKQLVEKILQPECSYTIPEQLPDALTLTTEQALAVTAIQHTFGKFQSFLLDGVTGSGKTEVYLQSIQPLIQQQQQVLVIVPEIGLTPQTLARFQARFQVPVLCWHSGLTDHERLDCWLQAKSGAAAIIIGTRSALFLPFKHLGLIIIDEEHDPSLKQQDGFRYHARDLAIKRAAIEHCPIILGSATPSMESLYNCQQQRFIHLPLQQRATGQTLPEYQLIDLKQQTLQYGLAQQTISMIQQQLAMGFQVLLFLNRRGYAPALCCQECGWLTACDRCSAFTTYHKQSHQLVCHHCGTTKSVPRQCTDCGSTRLIPVGQGTEQLEEHLQQLFPDIAITRLDRDSTRRKGTLTSALAQITAAGPRLILGTQMLAKGHHFPFVSLVVIVNVDGALYSSDFRAPEHLAQLLTQVSGRAGRGSVKGKVVLQTFHPEHPLLQDIIQNGYPSFARSALHERQLTQLPPYQYLAIFRAEAHQSELCQQWLQQLAELSSAYPQVQLLGPVTSPLERRAGKYRWQLQLYCTSRTVLHRTLQHLLLQLAQWPLSRKVKWQLDVDPVDLS